MRRPLFHLVRQFSTFCMGNESHSNRVTFVPNWAIPDKDVFCATRLVRRHGRPWEMRAMQWKEWRPKQLIIFWLLTMHSHYRHERSI
jgi:hypothetical protein